MTDALKKLVLALAAQIPLLGGLALWWNQAQQHPLGAALIAVAYEVLAFALAFSKKVWAKLEDKAVERTADWVLGTVSSFAPGFPRRYRRQIAGEHGIFNVRGLGLINTFTLELDQVFVELRIAPSGNPQRPNIDPIAAKAFAGNRPVWDFLRAGEHRRDDATALAIIGPPGSGKTTLLQHVALTLATNRQRRYRIRAHIPVLLFLRDHAAAITQEKAPALGKLAQDYFGDSGRFPTLKPPPGWFERQLERGKCLVLLDGLDEVAELDQREAVARWVDQQIKNYPDCRFVLTARPQGYREAPLQRAHILEVQPFSAAQVRKFIENWYLANEIVSSGHRDDANVRERASKGANDLLQRLSGAPALNELTVNPLLLTMIAMVHRYHGALPGSRVELYAEICEVLLGRWRQAKGVQDTLKTGQKLLVLRPLAAHMMERRCRDIAASEAWTAIAPKLRRVGVAGEAARRFLSDLQGSSGLVLEREAGRWSFAHLTFQEYLTAAHWLEQNAAARNWSDLVGDSWWHETLRLYAAQGDATPLVRACLASGSVPALTLAAECLEEASELDEDLRLAVEECVVAGLESPEPGRRRLAAEVRLSRRLRSLQRIDDQREIDLDYLTCAEYQLFVDDLREQNEYHQPDHWTGFSFPSGRARQPISGVRPEDAVAFCEWLTRRAGGALIYRLPSPSEARSYPAHTAAVAAWCTDEGHFSLIGLAATPEQTFRQELTRLSSASLFPLSSLALNFAPAHERVCVHALDRARLFAHERARGRALDGYRASALNLARILGLDLTRARARALGRDHALAHALVRARALARALALDLTRALALDLTRAYYHNLTSIVDAIKHYDFLEAQRLTQRLQSDSNVALARDAGLVSDLLAVAAAETPVAGQRAWRRYTTRTLEYVYIGYRELQDDDSRSWLRRWLRARSEVDDIKSEQQAVLEFYWWLQIVMAREEGKLPAWEGIRIVRELAPVGESGG